jgi:hypothetical protein
LLHLCKIPDYVCNNPVEGRITGPLIAVVKGEKETVLGREDDWDGGHFSWDKQANLDHSSFHTQKEL